jgi:hypothetical protein
VSKLVTIATQTSDCDIHNPLLSLDPAQYVDGVELYNEQNLAAFCHGGWLPISKGSLVMCLCLPRITEIELQISECMHAVDRSKLEKDNVE